MGIDPVTHRPRNDLNILANLPQLLAAANFSNLMNIPCDNVNALRLKLDATQLAKFQLLHNILQVLNTSPTPSMEVSNLLASNFQNHHLFEYLRLNSQLEGLLSGGQAGFAPQDITPIQSNFSNLETPQPPLFSDDYHPMEDDSKYCTKNNDQSSSSYVIPTSNTLPQLVSTSPECSTVNHVEKKNNPTDISTLSTTSTTFEPWVDLMDDEAASDTYWRDIIE